MEKIEIYTDYIKLNQLLKWINIADSGSMANDMIFDGIVSVNGEVEKRRGKKIYPGDVVEIKDIMSVTIIKNTQSQ